MDAIEYFAVRFNATRTSNRAWKEIPLSHHFRHRHLHRHRQLHFRFARHFYDGDECRDLFAFLYLCPFGDGDEEEDQEEEEEEEEEAEERIRG